MLFDASTAFRVAAIQRYPAAGRRDEARALTPCSMQSRPVSRMCYECVRVPASTGDSITV